MNCPSRTQENLGILLDYVAGRLDSVNAASLEAHMATCPECAEFGHRQTMVWDALDAWEPAPVSLDFNRRLWQRIDAMESAPWYRRFADFMRLTSWKPAIPLTVAALVIAAGFLFDHPARNTAPSAPTAAMQQTEVDQVQQTLDDIQLLHQFDATNPGS
jgi:anti-sigma factor RsiW